MVTARGEEVDRVVGLEIGADDYVVKPFGLRELIARIRAVTRRVGGRSDDARLHVGALEIDVRARRVALAGQPIELTAKEFDILAVLAEEPGSVVTRQTLLERVWQTTWYGPTKTIDVHVASLRRKLGDPAGSRRSGASASGCGRRESTAPRRLPLARARRPHRARGAARGHVSP